MARSEKDKSATQGRYVSSQQFWEASLAGKSFTTTHGKIGTAGQTSVRKFRSEAEARREYDRLIGEKLKKGYLLVSARPASKKAVSAKGIEKWNEVRSSSDEDFLEFVSAVIDSRPSVRVIKPYVQRLLRAALAARDLEDMLTGDARLRAGELDVAANDLLTRSRIAGEAKRAILEEAPMLSATEVSRLLGSKSENARQYANNLRKKGGLLSVPRANHYVYPAFQFDRRRRVVFPEIATVGRILNAAEDPWGVLSWWVSPNSRIHDRKPFELLGTNEAERLPALAEAVVEPIG